MKTCRAEISEFRAGSLANGDMLVTPTYRAPPVEDGFADVGILTRMRIAREIAAALNRELAKELPSAADVRGILKPAKRRKK